MSKIRRGARREPVGDAKRENSRAAERGQGVVSALTDLGGSGRNWAEKSGNPERRRRGEEG